VVTFLFAIWSLPVNCGRVGSNGGCGCSCFNIFVLVSMIFHLSFFFNSREVAEYGSLTFERDIR